MDGEGVLVMLISRKLVRARKLHRCDARSITFPCKRGGLIEPGATYVRLYGCARDGDPPYAMKLHPECERGDML